MGPVGTSDGNTPFRASGFMKKYVRHKTDYPGVWYIERKALQDKKTKEEGKIERIYYIAYRKDGKLVEEKAGRQFRDRMTPAKASELRAMRKVGSSFSNKERRAKQKAEKEAREAERFAESNRPTIHFLFEQYLESKGELLKGARTDKSRFEIHLKGVFGNCTPQEIDPLAVDRLRKFIAKSNTPASVRNVLELLRRIINYGVKNQLCPPLGFAIELPKVQNERIEVLTDEQFRRLHETWAEYPDRHIVNLHRIIAWTGMRASEPCRLKWEDVDFRHGILVKRDTKSGKDKPLRMSETVTNILSEQREFLDAESDEMRSSPYVFPRRDGGQRNPDGWRKRVKEICNRAGIPETYRPNYCLRDTIASTLLSNGATLDEVGYQLGHEPGSPMIRRYAKFIEGAQQRIVNRADELMRGKIKSDPKVIDLDEHRSKIGA